jgi:prolyl oligopeptidase
MFRTWFAVTLVLLVFAGAIVTTGSPAAGTGRFHYPETATVNQADDYHGTQVADPYRWLEDVDSDQTKAWVAAQNKLTFGFLEGIAARERLKQRLTALWDYTRYSTPFKKAGHTFFFKNDGLQPQSVLYVQDGEGEPRVLLDPNTLSEDGTVSLGGLSVSEDGELLAWAKSVSGSDWQTWYVRRVDTGTDLPDEVEWSKFSGAAWLPDASAFYYSRYDEPQEGEAYEDANYYQKVYLHEVGMPQSEDRLIYERPDHKDWGFGAGVSEDGRYLILHVWQGTATENRIYYKDLKDPSGQIIELLNDFDASYEFVGNDGGVFYFKTDLDAPRGCLIAIDTVRPDRANWRTLVPESEDPLESATMLNDSFVLTTMHDVVNKVRLHALDGSFLREIPLPGLGSVGGFAGRREDTDTYYVFTSYLNPSEIYHYDFATGTSTLFRKPEIDFDFSLYQTEQVFYHSKDGTRIPMFIVHKKGLAKDGSNPTILYGYGGFNIAMGPQFSTGLLPWLEMGGIFASANLRGGGEYGEKWHEAGMLKNKQNVFDDFIAAAEYLIQEGFTSTPKLAVYGGSNGGTLVGAVVNQRPDLFGAAIAAVGVMDMLRFHKWTIGWAWVSDYGSSEDPDMFPTLYAYSPYHNIVPGKKYPAVMVTTADHDDRVMPAHSFKYAARLQTAQAGDAPILIRIQTKSGHGGGKPTAMIIQETVDRYAFLGKVLGMKMD